MELIIFVLIGINVVAYFIPYLINFSGKYGDSFTNFLALGWKSNPEIRDGEYYRLLTSMFLHGDFFHLLFNMYSLYQIGPAIINLFKPSGFAIVYFVSGIVGSLLSYFFNSNPSVGASGAIFGLVGALGAVAIVTQNYGLLINIFLILVINFLYALDPIHRIDNFGHLGGLVTGFLLGFILIFTRAL